MSPLYRQQFWTPLWHVLFECPATCATKEISDVQHNCREFVQTICNSIKIATEYNAESLNDTRKAGVSHDAIAEAIHAVQNARTNYVWDCIPGRWLIYTILLAVPFPEKVVCPDAVNPLWQRPQTAKARNLRGMPKTIPKLPDSHYTLPLAMGKLFDCTILSNDALRPLADAWCDLATSNLLAIGRVVRPLRAAATLRLLAMESTNNASPDDCTSGSMTSSSTESDSDSESDPD